jgi:hypothetical protein
LICPRGQGCRFPDSRRFIAAERVLDASNRFGIAGADGAQSHNRLASLIDVAGFERFV